MAPRANCGPLLTHLVCRGQPRATGEVGGRRMSAWPIATLCGTSLDAQFSLSGRMAPTFSLTHAHSCRPIIQMQPDAELRRVLQL